MRSFKKVKMNATLQDEQNIEVFNQGRISITWLPCPTMISSVIITREGKEGVRGFAS